MMSETKEKPIHLHPAAKKVLNALPTTVRQNFEFGLAYVAEGFEPKSAKALKGFGGRQVLELRENDRSGTYRAVYTVKFDERIYVLHVFQKKSKKGIATDKADLDLVRSRLKWAEVEHHRWRTIQERNP